MYNVIVADDEKNIREGIVELIEWEKLGCKVLRFYAKWRAKC